MSNESTTSEFRLKLLAKFKESFFLKLATEADNDVLIGDIKKEVEAAETALNSAFWKTESEFSNAPYFLNSSFVMQE